MLLAALLVLTPLHAHAQHSDELNGRWVVQRAGDDELAFVLHIEVDTVRIEVLKRLGNWPVLPDAATLSAGTVFSVDALSTGSGQLNLEHGNWHARLIVQSQSTALFLSEEDPRIGIAHRLTTIDPDHRGEWERATLTPAGPRIRRVIVEESRVVFFDSLDRSESVAASGVACTGPARAIALFPTNESGTLAWLYPLEGGYLALEAGDDEFQVVYRPDETPSWLGDEMNDAIPELQEEPHPTGRWMIGSGDRSRQTHILDFTTTPASLLRLGDELGTPVSILIGSSSPYWRIAVGIDDDFELRHLLFVDDDRGVMWRTDDNRYQTLRRVVETPIAFCGEWRVERAGETLVDHVAIVGGVLRLSSQDNVLPVFSTSPSEALLELTILRGGHRGSLLRLWSVGDGDLVSDDGDHWRRPGTHE